MFHADNKTQILHRNDELLHNADMFREKFGEENMLTADFGHRLPVRVLKQVVYPFIEEKVNFVSFYRRKSKFIVT